MNTATRAWLLSQLGTDTNIDDLADRLARLGSARKVALEVLYERKAKMLASPLVLGISNVLNVSYAANITALERQIAELEDSDAPPAPDEPGYGDTPGDHIHTFRLRERPRR